MFSSSFINKKVVLVTGCSSGLGMELARQFIATNKYRVVITCRERSFAKLKDIFHEADDVLLRKLDITVDSEIAEIVNEICRIWGRIDILINNAGICYRSVVEHMDIESEMLQLKTNYLGPMSLVRSVLPIMREQKSGHIMNVSSVSGMISMPTMASYSASKHALEGATEALWYETKPYGINVTLLEPGFINSDSFEKVILSKKAMLSHQLKGPHSEYYYSMTPFVEKLMALSFANPESIASSVIQILEMKNPSLRYRVTLDAKLFAFLRKVMPSNLFHRIMFLLLPGARTWGFAKFRQNRRREKFTTDTKVYGQSNRYR